MQLKLCFVTKPEPIFSFQNIPYSTVCTLHPSITSFSHRSQYYLWIDCVPHLCTIVSILPLLPSTTDPSITCVLCTPSLYHRQHPSIPSSSHRSQYYLWINCVPHLCTIVSILPLLPPATDPSITCGLTVYPISVPSSGNMH